MRRAARVDGNQVIITQALRDLGASVQPLHTVGKGCPDLLVGYRGVNWILELKDDSQPPNKRRLTTDEQTWHDSWKGTVYVVETVEEALSVIRGGI